MKQKKHPQYFSTEPINSDVLNTKTANVRPIKGNQEVNEFFNCIIIKRVIVVLKQLCNEYKLIVF